MKTRAIFYGVLLVLLGVAGFVGWSWVNQSPYQHGGLKPNDRQTAPLAAAQPSEFAVERRPGSVDLDAEFDLRELRVPKDDIHTLIAKDAIPALTNPPLESAESAGAWLADDARVIVAAIDGEAVAAPLMILNYHEVAQLALGGVPIAMVYCPLCDSATVVDRRLPRIDPSTGQPVTDGQSVMLEFGVSGALYNSNVLLYERATRGLWSQLAMEAVSGPHSGARLGHLPVRVTTFAAAREADPGLMVVSIPTDTDRDYEFDPYGGYFRSDALRVPVRSTGLAMGAKELGLGLIDGGQAYFIPRVAVMPTFEFASPSGRVVVSSLEAGLEVVEAPAGVRTAQTLYFAWSAFYPNTEVVGFADIGGP